MVNFNLIWPFLFAGRRLGCRWDRHADCAGPKARQKNSKGVKVIMCSTGHSHIESTGNAALSMHLNTHLHAIYWPLKIVDESAHEAALLYCFWLSVKTGQSASSAMPCFLLLV